MSSPEPGPVVMSAVIALIAAYKDAGSIVENIKEQRRARGNPLPSDELEETLHEGCREIEKIQAHGVQKFGAAFEQGDGSLHQSS